eukprot:15444467-Alexandrium_andersonii.AAC.1
MKPVPRTPCGRTPRVPGPPHDVSCPRASGSGGGGGLVQASRPTRTDVLPATTGSGGPGIASSAHAAASLYTTAAAKARPKACDHAALAARGTWRSVGLRRSKMASIAGKALLACGAASEGRACPGVPAAARWAGRHVGCTGRFAAVHRPQTLQVALPCRRSQSTGTWPARAPDKCAFKWGTMEAMDAHPGARVGSLHGQPGTGQNCRSAGRSLAECPEAAEASVSERFAICSAASPSEWNRRSCRRASSGGPMCTKVFRTRMLWGVSSKEL